MALSGINLIPAHRLEARRRRSLRRRWVVACGGYAVLAAAAAAAPHLLWADDGPDAGLPGRLAEAGAEVSRTSGDLARARAELDAVEAVLRSSRAIAEQPDWSGLLALLAAKAGDDVFLRECGVRPRDPAAFAPGRPAAAAPRPAGGKPPPPPDTALVVGAAGLGASQASVSQFALRLEATGLFDKVRLVETSRETAVGLPLVAFRIECTLAEPAAAANAPGPAGRRQVAGGEP